MEKEHIMTTLVIILVAAVVLGSAIRYIFFYKHEHFTCPICGRRFKPKVLNMIFAANAVEGKIIKCPHCHSKEYMEPEKDETH